MVAAGRQIRRPATGGQQSTEQTGYFGMSPETAAEQLQMLQSIEERKSEQRARKAQQDEVVYQQWATFRVDNELYAIDVMQVKEVLRYSEITPGAGGRAFGTWHHQSAGQCGHGDRYPADVPHATGGGG